MEIFQKAVIIIAIIILVIVLFIIGMMLRQSTIKNTWPPNVQNCPDWWTDLSGNGSSCFNKQKLGTCNTTASTTMNFSQAPYIGNGATCAKYTWDNNCGVTWDGITSGINNPCNTST